MNARIRVYSRGLCLAVLMIGTAFATELRQSDVFYLDEGGLKPIVMKAKHPGVITFSRDKSAILSSLRPGQQLLLVGYAEKRFYVESRLGVNVIRGWVDVEALEPLSLEQRAELDQRRERTMTMKAAIARHEVLIGMTETEVIAALGQPTEKSRTTTAQGEEINWNFIVYRSEPYSIPAYVNGFYVTQTLYRKVAVGNKEVVFRNGVVVALREKESNAPPAEPVQVPVIISPDNVIPHPPNPKPTPTPTPHPNPPRSNSIQTSGV